MTTAPLVPRGNVDLKDLRLERLDGLRGLAALFVAWFHIYQRNELVRPAGIMDAVMNWTSEYGWLGVQAFFVITGFVIPYSVRAARYPHGSHKALRFLAKRSLRLYPPFAAAAALTFAIILAAPFVPGFRGEPSDLSAEWMAMNFTLTAPLFDEVWANPVFWSLLVEIQYYFVVAALLAASPLLKRGRFAAAMMICVASCVLSAVTPQYLHSLLSWAPLFVIGYLLYQHIVENSEGMPLLAVGSVAVAALLWSGRLLELVSAAITAALILLHWRPGRLLLGLGAISYSVYLIHYPIGTRAVRLFARIDIQGIEALAYLAAVGVVVMASWIFYAAFEKPSLRLSQSVRYSETRNT